MDWQKRLSIYLALILGLALLCAPGLLNCQVAVQRKEGLVHGFLVLRTLEGEMLADGDLLQNVREDRVTSRLVFHFKDGSLHDDTAVFSEHGHFRLISEHLIQKGPSFAHPLEMNLKVENGEVTVHYEDGGKQKTSTEHLQLPANIANGLVLILLKNIHPDTAETEVGFVAATPKPRLVKLVITSQGEEPFSTGDVHRKAVHYVVKVDLGGLPGIIADVFGKKPADTHVWILQGETPAFVKSEGPLAPGGPSWRIELVSPTWPHATAGQAGERK